MAAETARGLGHPRCCCAEVSAVTSDGRGEETQSCQLGPRAYVVLEVGRLSPPAAPAVFCLVPSPPLCLLSPL